MSTQQTQKKAAAEQTRTPIERAVAAERAKPTGEHVRIGLDKEGAIHHYAEHEHRIVVIKSGAIEHVERFADRPNPDKVATEWITEYIPAKRGWEQRDGYMTQHEFEELAEGFRTMAAISQTHE